MEGTLGIEKRLSSKGREPDVKHNAPAVPPLLAAPTPRDTHPYPREDNGPRHRPSLLRATIAFFGWQLRKDFRRACRAWLPPIPGSLDSYLRLLVSIIAFHKYIIPTNAVFVKPSSGTGIVPCGVVTSRMQGTHFNGQSPLKIYKLTKIASRCNITLILNFHTVS